MFQIEEKRTIKQAEFYIFAFLKFTVHNIWQLLCIHKIQSKYKFICFQISKCKEVMSGENDPNNSLIILLAKICCGEKDLWQLWLFLHDKAKFKYENI